MLDFPELGMEAVWRIEVEDFPAFIVVDDKGNDFFADTLRPVALTSRWAPRPSDPPRNTHPRLAPPAPSPLKGAWDRVDRSIPPTTLHRTSHDPARRPLDLGQRPGIGPTSLSVKGVSERPNRSRVPFGHMT